MTELLHLFLQLLAVIDRLIQVENLFKLSTCVKVCVGLPGIHFVQNRLHALRIDFDELVDLLEFGDGSTYLE